MPIKLSRLTDNTNNPETIKNYEWAVKSYINICNSINNTKNKEYENLLGKPIQLSASNFYSMTTNEYFVSTKVDGLRMAMIIADKKDKIFGKDDLLNDNLRTIFFIDLNAQFWILSEYIQLDNIDKCLIDGELIILNQKIIYDNKQEIKYYEGQEIIFSSFDILYGPINPQFKAEDDSEEYNDYILEPRDSNTMVGFKAKDKWVTNDRRFSLETLFNNPRNMYFISQINKKDKFTVLVSPFVDLDTVLENENGYDFMINTLLNKYSDDYSGIRSKTLPKINTDGLIFTPKYMPYITGTWSEGPNKQYKWKPSINLTIDVLIKKEGSRYIPYSFEGPLKYMSHEIVVKGAHELEKANGKIAECIPVFTSGKLHLQFVKIREDKEKPNAEVTIKSTIEAIELNSNKINILSVIKAFRNRSRKDISKYLKQVLKYFPKELMSLLLYSSTYDKLKIVPIINDKDIVIFDQWLTKAKNNPNLELETKLIFKKCEPIYLINKTIGQKIKDVTIVRYYGQNNTRTTFVNYATQIIEMDTIQKTRIGDIVVQNNAFDKSLVNFKISFSEEKEVLKREENLKKGTCQIRTSINNISLFWVIDVIQYVDFDNNKWQQALESFKIGPYSFHNKEGYKTRIEIEYKPINYLKEAYMLFKDDRDPKLLGVFFPVNDLINDCCKKVIKKNQLNLEVFKKKELVEEKKSVEEKKESVEEKKESIEENKEPVEEKKESVEEKPIPVIYEVLTTVVVSNYLCSQCFEKVDKYFIFEIDKLDAKIKSLDNKIIINDYYKVLLFIINMIMI